MRIWWVCVLLFVSTLSAGAQEAVHLYNNRLSATLPKGLLGLTPKAVAEEYPTKNHPQYVYKNARGDYSVAFNQLVKVLSVKDLLPFHTQLKQQLESQMPSIQWLGNRTQSVAGRNWEVLEFKANSQGENLHNWILITSWQGRALEILISAFDDVEGQPTMQVQEFINSLLLTE